MASFPSKIRASFCLCLAILIPFVNSFLDLEELKNVHYEIDISDKPVLIGRPVEQEVLYLASKFGQRYECQLPDMTDYEKEQEEEKVASEVGISELLKPMETAPCVVKTKDWWTYEFCYSKHIKQYHLEGGKEEDVKFLGHYESEMDWSNKTHKDAKRHKLNRYHSHSYVNGTECDITGKPREAEVRFMCAEGHGDAIDRIDEPSSCVYILTIHTTRICHHPFLRPPPNLKPKPVLCFPALEQAQYDHYTHVQEEKEKEKQEAIKRLKEQMKATKKVSVGDTSDDEDEDEEDAEEDPDVKKDPEDGGEIKVEEINLDGLVTGGGDDTEDLQKMMEAVLKTVKNAIQSVDDEVQDTLDTTKPKESQEKATEDNEDEDDDDEEEEDETKDILDDEDVEDLGFTKEELAEYLNKPYTELMKEFREGIDEMTEDPAELARLNALAEQLESSFENLETMDDVINDFVDYEDEEAEDEWILDYEDAEDLGFTREEVKEYLNKSYTELMEEFREGINEMTEDPVELARLNALAEQLEESLKNLEAMDGVMNDFVDYEDEEAEDEWILDYEDAEDLGFTREEMKEYLNKSYTELMEEFREGIDEMTEDPAELARLYALAEQLEESLKNLEAMDGVMNDFDEDAEELGFTREELDEYLNKSHTELMKEFRESIDDITDNHVELARLNALAEQLESSFDNLEAMDDVINDVSEQLDTTGTVDDEGTQHLVDMLTKLIREVLNGPHLKEYMRTYGLYLSTLLKDFRESIEEMTDDPEEIKRLNGLADELEKTIKELEEEEKKDKAGDKMVTDETEDAKDVNETGVEILEDSDENFVETLKKIIKDAKDSKSSSDKKLQKLPSSPADDGKVRVRVTRIKLDKENKNKLKLDDEEELQVFDSNHRKLEESVEQHLENAGVNIGGGGKVEVRILTYSPQEWPDGEDENEFTILSDDDSLYFKNMIVSLLGNDVEVKEQDRQQRLETNYHFTWDEESQGSTHHQVTGQEVTGHQQVTEAAAEEIQDNDTV